MRLTTQGIVLRETNYKEADKILTVLTRDWGKRTVKARGCRRKNSKLTAASQLLVYSELTLSERGEFTTLTEADPLEQFWSVRQDLETLGSPPILPRWRRLRPGGRDLPGAALPAAQLPLRVGHLEKAPGSGEGGL